MPASSWPARAQLVADRDRVAHAVERVVGVDQERAVAGQRLGVGAKRGELVAVEHHPAVRVGAAHRDAEQLAGEHVRGRGAAADVRRARRRTSPPSMPCARRRPNSSTGAPRAAWHHARRLGRDQRLEVDHREQRGLDQLRLRDRPADAHDRLVREHQRCPRAPRRPCTRTAARRGSRGSPAGTAARRSPSRRVARYARSSAREAQAAQVVERRARCRRRSRSRRRTAAGGTSGETPPRARLCRPSSSRRPWSAGTSR